MTWITIAWQPCAAFHNGSHDDLDRSYGVLATHVSEHALAVDA